MTPDVKAVLHEHLSQSQRDAVAIALNVAAASPMPHGYGRDEQAQDAVLEMWKFKSHTDDPLRLTKAAIRAILKGRARRIARSSVNKNGK